MDKQNEVKFVDDLLSIGNETEWLEYKANHQTCEKIGEYISALSNAAALHQKDEAYLIFGIDDTSKKIVGTTFDALKLKGKGNQDLESWLHTNLKPKIDFTIKEIDHPEGRLVVFFIKASKNGPVAFLSQKYIRVGSAQATLDKYPDKEAVIWERRRPFETSIAKENVTEEEILASLHYDSYFKMMEVPLPKTSRGIIDKFIEEKYVLQRNGKLCITNLGAILFAVDLSKFERLTGKALRIIRYKGNNKLEAIKDMPGHKGYAVGFENFISHVHAQLPSTEIIESGRRVTIETYAPKAIREFVANALVHQDFAMLGGPLVEIYDDRIEISNPGRPLVDPKRFIDTAPQSRNELLADSLRRLKICEKRGSGVDRALVDIEIAQLPAPSLESGEADVRVIIFARKDLASLTTEEKLRACYWHCCVKHVVEREPMTNASLCNRLGISEENKAIASRIIRQALIKKYIKPFDPDNKSLRYVKYVPYWA
jgi:ATP-dependent DNA helicase RecG